MIADTPCGSPFDLWAEVYDEQINPLLALEERHLPHLLPPLQDARILDVGCGTGRWLKYFERFPTASLVGTDPSMAMLSRARIKLTSTTSLHVASASSLPALNTSVDLVLASFVLSYVRDLGAFAIECARILNPGGCLLISDMHPVTSSQRHWIRSFNIQGETIQIPAHELSLTEIASGFCTCGLEVASLKEPSFDEHERPFFEHANRVANFEVLSGVPAIYLLKITKPVTQRRLWSLQSRICQTQSLPSSSDPEQIHLLANTKWAAGPETWDSAPLGIEDGFLVKAEYVNSESLDLTDYLILPGLINAHDHLEFALYPRLGRSRDQSPYANSPDWAREIHQTHAVAIAFHSEVPLNTRLWFGALRNLLCGVTTVCHHNRLHPELTQADFPVRVVSNFGWSHSLTFDPAIVEHHHATPLDGPFIIHAAEGTDHRSRNELQRLDRLNLLNQRTVLVHGLALTLEDIALLNSRGASLVLCTTSNQFLFASSIEVDLIQSIEHAALGSDSPLTAAGDLLDELPYLQDLPPEKLYSLVTASPAAILRLRQGEGHIRPGTRADLIAVRAPKGKRTKSPAQLLATLTLADIELVLLSGKIQMASRALYNRLPLTQRIGLHLLEMSTSYGLLQRWVRAPLSALFASAQQILGAGNIRLGHKEVRYVPTP